MELTQAIRISKACLKPRGPFLQTCSACGRRYWPADKENHLAYECRAFRALAVASTPKQSSAKPSLAKERCPVCGKARRNVQAHIAAVHPLRSADLEHG